MKKKTYQQPKMEVVQLDHADIICTSGSSTEGLTQDDFDWDE